MTSFYRAIRNGSYNYLLYYFKNSSKAKTGASKTEVRGPGPATSGMRATVFNIQMNLIKITIKFNPKVDNRRNLVYCYFDEVAPKLTCFADFISRKK